MPSPLKLDAVGTEHTTRPNWADLLYLYKVAGGTDHRIKYENLLQDVFHGVEAIGVVSFDNSTHILSVASITYWFQGQYFTSPNPITCDIDDFETLTANKLYYFYFDDETGGIECSDTAWTDLAAVVPIAIVAWNGSAGAILREWHNHTRDIDWHTNAHLTIGARYGGGLALTKPDAANDDDLQIESGSIWDEDLVSTISQQLNCRHWYQASAGVYTWVDSALPYTGTTGVPKFLDTDTYTLETFSAGSYACYWVYASNDTDRSIYIIPTQETDAYGNLNDARDESPPSLDDLNITPEIKLLYKLIYKGNGEFQEYQDFRNTSSLPAGGTAATAAASVSFIPYGDIAASNVQGAIEELDDEKMPKLAEVNNQTGTTYTIAADDNGKVITFENAGAIAVTLPDTLDTNFQCTIVQIGAGVPTVTRSGTDTINGAAAGVAPSAQWKGMYLCQFDAGEWMAVL